MGLSPFVACRMRPRSERGNGFCWQVFRGRSVSLLWRIRCAVYSTPAAAPRDEMFSLRRIAMWTRKRKIPPMKLGRPIGKPRKPGETPLEGRVVRRVKRIKLRGMVKC